MAFRSLSAHWMKLKLLTFGLFTYLAASGVNAHKWVDCKLIFRYICSALKNLINITEFSGSHLNCQEEIWISKNNTTVALKSSSFASPGVIGSGLLNTSECFSGIHVCVLEGLKEEFTCIEGIPPKDSIIVGALSAVFVCMIVSACAWFWCRKSIKKSFGSKLLPFLRNCIPWHANDNMKTGPY